MWIKQTARGALLLALGFMGCGGTKDMCGSTVPCAKGGSIELCGSSDNTNFRYQASDGSEFPCPDGTEQSCFAKALTDKVDAWCAAH
jgi:hypothetical protein